MISFTHFFFLILYLTCFLTAIGKVFPKLSPEPIVSGPAGIGFPMPFIFVAADEYAGAPAPPSHSLITFFLTLIAIIINILKFLYLFYVPINIEIDNINMVLNNTPWMMRLYFPSNFFYKEVIKKWTPIIDKMRLPYISLTDFMNAQIQTINFPGANFETVTQQREQYEVVYPGGKELEPIMGKDLNITFKLTESYLSYWIMWDQIDLYHHYTEESFNTVHKPCWMEPIHLTFLSDQGFQLTTFIFREITPTSISDLNLSYAAQLASYNTFTFGLKYNRFDIM